MSKITDERLAAFDTQARNYSTVIIPSEEWSGIKQAIAIQSLRSQPAGVRVKGLEEALEPFLLAAKHVVKHPAQYQGALMRTGGLSDARDLYAPDFARLLDTLSALEPQQEEAVAFEETGEYGRFTPIAHATPTQKEQESQRVSEPSPTPKGRMDE